jgi:selenium metabolism protein YedF
MREIDVRGLPCPRPVLETRRELEAGSPPLRVVVDNEASAENVRRFAESRGLAAVIGRQGPDWTVSLRGVPVPSREGEEVACASLPSPVPAPAATARTILVGAETLGRGNDDLGRILMQALLETMAVAERVPRFLVLVNGGVKLACEEDDLVAALGKVAGRGTEILCCGTCLSFFGLTDRLRVGRVSNALEIQNLLLEGNVVTWV